MKHIVVLSALIMTSTLVHAGVMPEDLMLPSQIEVVSAVEGWIVFANSIVPGHDAIAVGRPEVPRSILRLDQKIDPAGQSLFDNEVNSIPMNRSMSITAAVKWSLAP